MALVQIEQSDLDTAAAAIETIATAISNLPSGTLAAADESALNKAVSDAQAALSAKNPPVDTPPASA